MLRDVPTLQLSPWPLHDPEDGQHYCSIDCLLKAVSNWAVRQTGGADVVAPAIATQPIQPLFPTKDSFLRGSMLYRATKERTQYDLGR
jgi:hypothetical protein